MQNMTSNTESSVSYQYLRSIVDYLSQYKVDASALFAQFNIDSNDLSNANKRVSLDDYQKLLAKAGTLTNDDNVGLHIGECIKPGQYGVLGYAVMSCKTTKEVFLRHERYENLVSDRAKSTYTITPNNVRLTWNTGHESVSRQMAEENVTSWITFTRWITGQNLNPTSVHFTHPQPNDISEYQRIFDCPILFDQPMVEIHFPPRYAELPIIQHDPVMQKMMDAHAERLLQQFTHNDGFLGDVRKVLIDAMANDNASLEFVASELALTPRTLQRRLSEQDETFKSMLDKTRKALALTYINQSFISLPDLTYLLGFSDQTAFQRAFKKWTGLTPSKYRKQGELK